MAKCWREKVKGESPTHCDGMTTYESELEEGALGCFCFGVVKRSARTSPEHSKRFCLTDNRDDDDSVNIQIDLTDTDVAAIQTTFAGGMLAVYQRAHTMGVRG